MSLFVSNAEGTVPSLPARGISPRNVPKRNPTCDSPQYGGRSLRDRRREARAEPRAELNRRESTGIDGNRVATSGVSHALCTPMGSCQLELLSVQTTRLLSIPVDSALGRLGCPYDSTSRLPSIRPGRRVRSFGPARTLSRARPTDLSGRPERVVGQARKHRRAGPNLTSGRPDSPTSR